MINLMQNLVNCNKIILQITASYSPGFREKTAEETDSLTCKEKPDEMDLAGAKKRLSSVDTVDLLDCTKFHALPKSSS